MHKIITFVVLFLGLFSGSAIHCRHCPRYSSKRGQIPRSRLVRQRRVSQASLPITTLSSCRSRFMREPGSRIAQLRS